MATQNNKSKSREPFVATYRRIEANMRAKVSSGAWAAESLLPGRRELAKQYGVEVNTVQKAIGILLGEGLLRSEHGRGTFVSPAKLCDVPITEGDRGVFATKSLAIVCGWPEDFPRYPESQNIYSYYSITDALENDFLASGGNIATYYHLAPKLEVYDVDSIKSKYLAVLADKPDAVAVVMMDDAVAEEIAALTPPSIPIIFVMVERSHPGVLVVTPDHYTAGFMAANHLIEAGYDRLAFYSPVSMQWAHEREAGVRKAAARYRGRVGVDAVIESGVIGKLPDWDGLTQQWASGLIDPAIRGIGIVGVNDYVAAAIVSIAKQFGMVAGEDYGIIGFDNVTTGKMLGISTMAYPLEEMGREACRLLSAAISGRECAQHSIVRFKLIRRASTRPMSLPKDSDTNKGGHSWQIEGVN